MAEENKIPEMDWANEMTTNVTCNTDNPELCESCSG